MHSPLNLNLKERILNMKRLICALMAVLTLFPLVVFGEETHFSRYHDIYESMKVENAELSYAQLKEVVGGRNTYREFPDYGLRLYNPLNSLRVIDEHYILQKGIRRHFEKSGFVLADESLYVAYDDDEQKVFYNITRVMNPDFEGCNKPHDFSHQSKNMSIYEENILSVNGMPCALTVYFYDNPANPIVVFECTAFIRTSDDSVFLVRGSSGVYPGARTKGKPVSESELEYPVFWEKNCSFLLCFAPMQ